MPEPEADEKRRCHGTKQIVEHRDDGRGAEFNNHPDSTAGTTIYRCPGCPDCEPEADQERVEKLGPLEWPAKMERVWDEDGVTCDGEFQVIPTSLLLRIAGEFEERADAAKAKANTPPHPESKQYPYNIGRAAAYREIATRLRQAASPKNHDAYVDCLDGGWRGFQAACWDCEWRGQEHLRGDEDMNTEAARQHKNRARAEAAEHRAASPNPSTKDTERSRHKGTDDSAQPATAGQPEEKRGEMKHHPDCTTVTLTEFAARGGHDTPPADIADERLCDCHPDCPIVNAAIQRGLELADKYGWA